MTEFLSQTATAAAALALVLALIWIAARLFHRARLGRGPTAMRPAGTNPVVAIGAILALDSRRRVYVLTCQGHSVLLLTGGTTDIVLGWLPEHPTP